MQVILFDISMSQMWFSNIYDWNELTRSCISVSRCTNLVLDFILSGFKPKVGISFFDQHVS